jgi:hypothetical protein
MTTDEKRPMTATDVQKNSDALGQTQWYRDTVAVFEKMQLDALKPLIVEMKRIIREIEEREE